MAKRKCISRLLTDILVEEVLLFPGDASERGFFWWKSGCENDMQVFVVLSVF
jgi:hypothetical protein